MKLSFGMIFSIFLIIAFIVFAFFAIQKFLATQQSLQYNQFLGDFQVDIDAMWKQPMASSEVSYALPNSIKQICFVNGCIGLGFDFNCASSNDNLAFNSTKKIFDSHYFSHLDIEGIIGSNEKLCFNTRDGRVYMNLEKKYNNEKVGVSII